MRRAYVCMSFGEFLSTSDAEILGALTAAHGHDIEVQQRNAWQIEIAHLRTALPELGPGNVLMEFAIPRMGKRADVVLIWQGCVFVIEYKVYADKYDRTAVAQVVDYALDLKNFHAATHNLPVIPVLVATEAEPKVNVVAWGADGIANPQLANRITMSNVLHGCIEASGRAPIDLLSWLHAPYRPTPTIIEAARALYQGHNVEEISRSEGGATNVVNTAAAVSQLIEVAKHDHRKAICFVTGVPGSGKTLAGLNLTTDRMLAEQGEHAVFLSGNGPLVDVLTEGLTRDEVARTSCSRDHAKRRARSFIQNVHHFRDECLRSEAPPNEQVVVFDEAQRAWNQEQTSKFMRQKRGREGFSQSEPAFLLSAMNRHRDWCVVVCLVGEGQEIHTGEAGLAEWFSVLASNHPDWMIAHADGPLGGHGLAASLPATMTRIIDPALHLAVSIRSFRAELLSDFVAAVLAGQASEARSLSGRLTNFPMVITRSLAKARTWLRGKARGTERFGLVASSNALRLKPIGIHVKAGIDTGHWFLDDAQDVRSSFALEDVATEFDIQGLELDWVGVLWDANLRRDEGGWGLYSFRGTEWQRVNDRVRRTYLVNSYRVLLTRARQGCVVVIPEGDIDDDTRQPEFYGGTFQFLLACGFAQID